MSNKIMKKYIQQLEEAAGEDGIVSRLGGDNFVLLFRKKNLDQVTRLLEGSPVRFGDAEDGRVMISAHAGMLVIPEDYYYHDFGDLMDRIINAYNVSKSGARGDIIFSNEKMIEQKDHAMRIKQVFPVALQNEEILVFYQPKISVSTNTIVGAEALSRWYHNGKLVMPMDFIPVLEQSMDICKLDFYVLDHVCRDIRRWLDEGKPAVRISINLSRRHLIDLDLLDRILSIVDRHRVPHHFIEFELTETTTDVEFKDLKRIVTGLQEAGIYTSVDDFGIGYSSLNLIKEIPWNILKVDKNFLPLNEQATQNKQNIMFHHVVNMAKEIGLTCVAEGVETSDQVDILRKNSCDIAQGFYYDKPLPVREFEKRLEQHVYSDKT
jgi:EAL domain-containing protein (putative c-di-GMP-specific phosphodiesterase class I)